VRRCRWWAMPLIGLALGCAPQEPPIGARLRSLPGASVEELEVEKPYVEAFDLRLEQPLDHSDPSSEIFEQRILVSHRGFDRPVVLVTEGYELGVNYAAELAPILGANQVRVEHRFMGDSKPNVMGWEYLTLVQAAEDYHRIVGLLGEIYPGPWISTGWSKGGQTALIFRSHYPDDVVATVAYDAPLPRALEDPRIDAHFHEVGTAVCRERLAAFQRRLLERRDELLPLFRWYAKGKGWELSVGEAEVFDYTVLEFPFSFWQYSDADCDALPAANANDDELLAKLVEVADAGWFSDATLDSPSFHQFCTELGFYGYDERPFADLLTADDYPLCIFAPDWTEEEYDPGPMEELDRWLRTDAERVMSIYGGVDPWSAPAIPVGEGDQVQLWDLEGGHFTFIRTLSDENSMAAREALARWLDVPLAEVGE